MNLTFCGPSDSLNGLSSNCMDLRAGDGCVGGVGRVGGVGGVGGVGRDGGVGREGGVGGVGFDGIFLLFGR